MNTVTIVGVVAAAAIQIGYYNLRRLFPFSPSAPGPSSEELKGKYQKWLSRMAVFMMVTWPVSAATVYPAFRAAGNAAARALPEADITFAPAFPGYWGLPAGLFGLAFAGFASMWAVKALLGPAYPEFLLFWSKSGRMDPVKTNLVLMSVVMAMAMMSMLLGLEAHVQLRGETLIVHGFTPIERTYDLAQLRSIRSAPRFVAPNGDVVTRREYVLSFGRRRWDTMYIPSDPPLSAKTALVAEISKRAGVPIDELPVLQRSDF